MKLIRKTAILSLCLSCTLAISNVNALASNKSVSSDFTNGWNLDDGNWYYFQDGNIKTGWMKDNNSWFFLDNDGIMKTGWIYDNGNWYYLYGDGTMAHDCNIDGYYLNDNGSWSNDNLLQSGNLNQDLKDKLSDLGYNYMERVFDYNNNDDKYKSAYKYTWYDGKDGNSEYATVNVFDSGACSILIRKNCTAFDDKLKSIFKSILPTKSDELLNIINSNPQDQTVELDDKDVKISNFSDSIGININ